MKLTGSRCIASLFSRHLSVRTYRFLTKNKFQVDLSWSTGIVVFTFLLKYFVYFTYEGLALESMWGQNFENFPQIWTLPRITLFVQSRRTQKISLNFCFHTSFWCLKRFYGDLKAIHKSFEAPQRSVKIKI